MDFIKTYFTAEKNESLIFILFGILTIGFSVYALLKWGDSFYRGFAIPVILVGIIRGKSLKHAVLETIELKRA